MVRENAPIRVGDEVTHRRLTWPGVILSLDGDKALVRWGAASSSWEKIGDLLRTQPWKAGDEVTVFNAVSNPEHYSKGLPDGVEVIDIIRAQKGSWELSNAIKYLLRAQFKGNYIQDLEKCVQYLTWEIERNGDPEWRDGTDD